MRLEATNRNVRGGLNKPPPLPGRVNQPGMVMVSHPKEVKCTKNKYHFKMRE